MTLFPFGSKKTKQSFAKKLTVALGDIRSFSSSVKQVRDTIVNTQNYRI